MVNYIIFFILSLDESLKISLKITYNGLWTNNITYKLKKALKILIHKTNL